MLFGSWLPWPAGSGSGYDTDYVQTAMFSDIEILVRIDIFVELWRNGADDAPSSDEQSSLVTARSIFRRVWSTWPPSIFSSLDARSKLKSAKCRRTVEQKAYTFNSNKHRPASTWSPNYPSNLCTFIYFHTLLTVLYNSL